MKNVAKKVYDVTIIGGGPAGTSLALLLAKKGLKVAIVERSDYKTLRIGESLAPTIQPLLEKLDIWDAFCKDKHLPIYGVHSSRGSDELIFQSYIFNIYKQGWHINREIFDKMLIDAASENGAMCFMNTDLLSFSQVQTHNWQLQCRQKEQVFTVDCNFLVDAAGRTSSIATTLGAQRLHTDKLIGLAVKCETCYWPKHLQGSIVVESCESGWWYSVPIADSFVIVVYLTDSDLYDIGNKNIPDYWFDRLRKTNHIAQIVKINEQPAPLIRFPAFSQRIESLPGSSWLPVGDSLVSRDPLSGQGIYYGLESALQSTDVIIKYLSGREGVIHEHFRDISAAFDSYLQTQKQYYLTEQRWRQFPFWRRRHQVIQR